MIYITYTIKMLTDVIIDIIHIHYRYYYFATIILLQKVLKVTVHEGVTNKKQYEQYIHSINIQIQLLINLGFSLKAVFLAEIH